MQLSDAPIGGGDPADLGSSPEAPESGARWAGPGWVGALLGVLALLCGLVVAEVISGIVKTDSSPLVEVGNRVVDLVPKPLRDWAISTFGTADKAVLLGVLIVVLLAVAVLVGTLWVRGAAVPASAITVVITFAGALSALGRGGSGAGAVFATLVGGGVTLAVLWRLGGLAIAGWPRTTPVGDLSAVGRSGEPADAVQAGDALASQGVGQSRRRFFKTSAALGGGAAIGAGIATWLRSNATVAVERLGITLPEAAAPLPEVPAGVSVDLDGVSPFLTPNENFYRIDTAFVAPRVSVEDWSLRVHGMVDREVALDFEALLKRPMIELDATIACVSNQVGGDLIGTARWLGCRLDDLLNEAGIDPAADQIVGRSVDGFTAGFPTATLDGRDAIIAVGMNGEPLPTNHGYPARLIVPGLYGYVSATKWLSEIELTTFDSFEGYWIPRGWDREAPVQTSSRIDTPRDSAEVAAGDLLAVGGVAWAMTREIERVEVRLDGGEWEQATLGEQYSGTTWRQWRHEVMFDEGTHELSVRATDSDGLVQSSEVLPPGPNASSGYHTIAVTAR